MSTIFPLTTVMGISSEPALTSLIQYKSLALLLSTILILLIKERASPLTISKDL